MHPVRNARRAVTPKPVKRATRVVYGATNPLGILGDLTEDAVVSALRPRRSRSTTTKHPSRQTAGGPSRTAAARDARALAALEDEQVLAAALGLHRIQVDTGRGQAPPPIPVDSKAVRRQLERRAVRGISIFRRNDRAAARAFAASRALEEIAAEEARRSALYAEQRQALKNVSRRLAACDPDLVIAAVVLAGKNAPFEMRPLSAEGRGVDVVVELPGLELVSDRKFAVTSTGLPTTATRFKTERNELYAQMAASVAMAAARTVIAAAPGANNCRVLVLRQLDGAPSVPVMVGEFTPAGLEAARVHESTQALSVASAVGSVIFSRKGRTQELVELTDSDPTVAELAGKSANPLIPAEHAALALSPYVLREQQERLARTFDVRLEALPLSQVRNGDVMAPSETPQQTAAPKAEGVPKVSRSKAALIAQWLGILSIPLALVAIGLVPAAVAIVIGALRLRAPDPTSQRRARVGVATGLLGLALFSVMLALTGAL
jgi:hypothetical protein